MTDKPKPKFISARDASLLGIAARYPGQETADFMRRAKIKDSEVRQVVLELAGDDKTTPDPQFASVIEDIRRNKETSHSR